MRRYSTAIGFVKIICVVACIGGTIMFVDGQNKKQAELDLVKEELSRKIDEQLEMQSELYLEMEYTLSDTYVEKIARERLGLVQSDEIIFVDNGE